MASQHVMPLHSRKSSPTVKGDITLADDSDAEAYLQIAQLQKVKLQKRMLPKTMLAVG